MVVVVLLDIVFVGDNFDVALVRVDINGLSADVDVFGLVNVVDRIVDGAGADLTRVPIDDTVDFVVDTFDAVVDGFGATDLNTKREQQNYY